MKFVKLALIILSFPAFSCAQTAEKQDNKLLIVSFYSIGSGVNHDAIKRFKEFVENFGNKIGKTIDQGEKSWGREGEKDFCMDLKELNEKQQNKFIRQANELLKEEEFVKIMENIPCER